jgi:hypothetical protein
MSQVPWQEIDGTAVSLRSGSEGVTVRFSQFGWWLWHLWRPARARGVLIAGSRLNLLSLCSGTSYWHNFSSWAGNCGKFHSTRNSNKITRVVNTHMDRRRNPRITAMLPVRVWGVDAHALPFMQLATVRNISSSGAVVQGLRRQIRPGEVLEVQSGDDKAQFKVVWVGRTGTSREGEIGLETLPSEPCLWDQDLSRYSELVGTG